MREMSVTEQRYKAVLPVIGDGRTVSEVATDWGVSRRTMLEGSNPSSPGVADASRDDHLRQVADIIAAGVEHIADAKATPA
jgi:hypothetical protein